MEEELIVSRETVAMPDGRNLYSYTFHEATPSDRLLAMIETVEIGVIGAFLNQHPGLELGPALALARKLGREEAVRELESR